MAIIVKPNTFSAGTTILSAQVNANFDTIIADYNGNIDYTNLDPAANIPDTMLAQITTGSKVSGAALIGLASTPSGAGIIPIANLASGTPNGSKFIRDDGTLATASYTPTAANALSGSVIQTVGGNVITSSTGTTLIPFDNTIPQNGEGDEYMTQAITPNNSSNILLIKVSVFGGASNNGNSMAVALFQDATASALAAAPQYLGASGNQDAATCTFTYKMTAGTTSATTFKVRAGLFLAGTFTFNGVSGTRLFGGVGISSLIIQEIKA